MKILTKILNILKFVVTVVKAIAGFDKDKPIELAQKVDPEKDREEKV